MVQDCYILNTMPGKVFQLLRQWLILVRSTDLIPIKAST